MIEQSYKPKDSQDYVTQTISITPEQAQGIIFGLQKAWNSPWKSLPIKTGERVARPKTPEEACAGVSGCPSP